MCTEVLKCACAFVFACMQVGIIVCLCVCVSMYMCVRARVRAYVCARVCLCCWVFLNLFNTCVQVSVAGLVTEGKTAHDQDIRMCIWMYAKSGCVYLIGTLVHKQSVSVIFPLHLCFGFHCASFTLFAFACALLPLLLHTRSLASLAC